MAIIPTVDPASGSPAGAPTGPSGASDVSRTLANVGLEVGRSVAKAGLAAQKASDEADAKFAAARDARQYNDSVASATVSLNDSIDELESDPSNFETRTESYRAISKDLVESHADKFTNPRNFEKFRTSLNSAIAIGDAGIRSGVRNVEIDAGRASTVDVVKALTKTYTTAVTDLDRGAVDDEFLGIMEDARDVGLFTEQELSKIRDDYQLDSRTGRLKVDASIDPQVVLDNLNSYGLSPVEKAKATGQLNERIEAVAAEDRRIERERNAQRKSIKATIQSEVTGNFRIALARNQLSEEAIVGARQEGMITPTVAAELTVGLIKATKKKEANATLIDGVNQAIQGGVPLDPKDDIKAVDAHFAAQVLSWGDIPPEEWIDRSVNYVASTNVVPSAVQSLARSHSRSGTSERAFLAAELVDRIRVTSPATIKDFDATTRAFSFQVMDNTKAGIKPDQAVKLARRNVYELTEPEREAARVVGREASKNNGSFIDGFLDDKFDITLFGGAPEAGPVLTAEFNDTFVKFMGITNGDVESSQELARDSLLRVWGRTDVGETPRMMKYAPEAMYGVPGGDNTWISDQFDTDMEAAGHVPGDVFLMSNTALARTDKPLYPVMTRGEDGLLIPILNARNQVLGWRPDFKETEKYKTAIADRNEGVADAISEREHLLEIQTELNEFPVGARRIPGP